MVAAQATRLVNTGAALRQIFDLRSQVLRSIMDVIR
jgi:hypothetical protein